MEARLVGEDDEDVPVGPKNSGELWLRGPLIMKYVSLSLFLFLFLLPFSLFFSFKI